VTCQFPANHYLQPQCPQSSCAAKQLAAGMLHTTY